jgi:hypothetical protein
VSPGRSDTSATCRPSSRQRERCRSQSSTSWPGDDPPAAAVDGPHHLVHGQDAPLLAASRVPDGDVLAAAVHAFQVGVGEDGVAGQHPAAVVLVVDHDVLVAVGVGVERRLQAEPGEHVGDAPVGQPEPTLPGQLDGRGEVVEVDAVLEPLQLRRAAQGPDPAEQLPLLEPGHGVRERVQGAEVVVVGVGQQDRVDLAGVDADAGQDGGGVRPAGDPVELAQGAAEAVVDEAGVDQHGALGALEQGEGVRQLAGALLAVDEEAGGGVGGAGELQHPDRVVSHGAAPCSTGLFRRARWRPG